MADVKSMSVEELHAYRAELHEGINALKAQSRKAGKLLDMKAQGKDEESLKKAKAKIEADIEALENM